MLGRCHQENKINSYRNLKLLEDVKALEQLEDIRVALEKLENKKSYGYIEETQCRWDANLYWI